jgi:alkylation response protein AidB-like acyl-CoA dehydrogenase
MDFSLSSEQQLLEDTVMRLVREHWSYPRRTVKSRDAKGFSTDTWALMADLGLLGVPLRSEYGGMDGGGTELMILHKAFGRGLAPEPYLATVVLGAGLVQQLGTAEQCGPILPEVIAGRRYLALACHEPASRYEATWVETRAMRDGTSYRLRGRKAVVLNGDTADQLIVIARTSGEKHERAGLSAFLVSPGQTGVTIRGYPTIDGRRAAEVRLDDVRVAAEARLGAEGQAADALEHVLAAASAALCAEAVGAMEVAWELTLDYLKTRRQFGVPIGRFQVLQHRIVDMRIALEKATSMAILAASSLQASAKERDQRIAAARALIGRSGRFVAEQAIQLHGGIGMTDEAPISHYAKRIVMIDHWFGDADHFIDRFIALADAS